VVERIRTERMVLRALRAEDRGTYVRMHALSAAHFQPWMNSLDDPGTPELCFDRELERMEADLAAGVGHRLVGLLDDGRMAGVFSLSQIFRGSFLSCYAGWRVAADCIGRGLGTEGVVALLDLAFAPEPVGLGLHRVQANVIPDNHASIRVAEKAGFRVEGTAKAYLHIGGRWRDHLMFAKTAEEHALRYLKG
jgi:ribosomal-protein-alanine N-acetyltransferase